MWCEVELKYFLAPVEVTVFVLNADEKRALQRDHETNTA